MAGFNSSLSTGNKSHAEWMMLPIIQSHQRQELVAVATAGGGWGGVCLHGKTWQMIKCDLGVGYCPAI